MKYQIFYILLLAPLFLLAQKKILVFHETNGFRHGSISAGIAMFESLGNESNDWITDNSQNSNVFTDANLAQYDAVVFLNTSGTDENGSDGDLLSASEKLAFENFIKSGKGFIGIHAATDTYRNKIWPFYNELVGGIVQTNPNHTSNNFNADLTVLNEHPIIDFLGPIGTIWNKNEEYYYWQNNGGQLSNDNTVLLEVEQTGSNSYDAARPITWYKESISYDDDNNDNTEDVSISGIRSFYTALGHNSADYNSNTNFRTMLKNATLWAIGNTLSLSQNTLFHDVKLFPNPTNTATTLRFNNITESFKVEVFNTLGNKVINDSVNPTGISSSDYFLNTGNLSGGVYLIKLSNNNQSATFKLLKL